MEIVSKQEYDHILSELDLVTTKFIALEQENQKLLGDFTSECLKGTTHARRAT
jgi:hypothetical protein